MTTKFNMIDMKRSIDVKFSVEITLIEGDMEKVFHSEVLELGENVIWFAPILWFGEAFLVNVGSKVRVSFLLGETFYSYKSEIAESDDSGKFSVKDVKEIHVVGEREEVRIATDFPTKYKVLKNASGFPVEDSSLKTERIINISSKGLGFISSNQLEKGSIIFIQFALPETKHGIVQRTARVLRSRSIILRKINKFFNEIIFIDDTLENEKRLYEWIFAQVERLTKTEFELKSADPAVQFALKQARMENVETIWDRLEAMHPQCGFGELGICCRNCLMGPCRIDVFGEGARKGICGASADTIVARNLLRMLIAGASAHSEHATHQIHLLKKVVEGEVTDYRITDKNKLKSLVKMLGKWPILPNTKKLAKIVTESANNDYTSQDEENICEWLASTLTPGRLKTFSNLKVLPYNLNNPLIEGMHRTHIGVDDDPVNVLLGGIKVAIADYTAMRIATDISDVLFGTPQPVLSYANLGVLNENAVNIAVHGHNPILSDIICDIAPQMNNEAVKAGAKNGINIVGICCTGNEVLMRRGIPSAGNFLSQEIAIITGALDAMVVDYQCILPSVGAVASCYHTKVISTMPFAKLTADKNVIHIPIDEKNPLEAAKIIIQKAIQAFTRRNPKKIAIPQYREKVITGFSTEAIIDVLKKINEEDPLKPLIDNIISSNIKGIALFCGCNNINIRQDYNTITMVKDLLKNNVLVVSTGCNATALAKAGLMSPEAAMKYAGDRLCGVLTTIGEAAGLKGPLPPVFNMGSCVDNSRVIAVAVALANRLGVDISELPVVASAPEPMAEKALVIGTWAVSMGITTHIGQIPPIWGGPKVIEVLTKTLKDLLGGYFIIELSPTIASTKLLRVLDERRQKLGI
ncbi:MAG: anaerobic carbon-monoxide dehydrogenase catalytic subunit [Chitinispirillia bacterium]